MHVYTYVCKVKKVQMMHVLNIHKVCVSIYTSCSTRRQCRATGSHAPFLAPPRSGLHFPEGYSSCVRPIPGMQRAALSGR